MVKNWSKAQPWLKEATPAAAKLVASGALEPIEGDAASVAAPFVPQRIFCVASNYAKHASEMGTKLAAKAQSRSEEHTSELQSLMRISYDVFCLTKKIQPTSL